MNFISYVSVAIIPFFVFYIVGIGLSKKRPVYEDFLEGAKSGLKTVVEIMPTLIGLMIAVGILRASGFLDFVSGGISFILSVFDFPSDLLPIALVKMFSSSAATSLLIDLYKKHGADSTVGIMASILLSSTETIFYTVSIYFMSVRVKKTGYTIAGALFATLAGLVASILIGSHVSL